MKKGIVILACLVGIIAILADSSSAQNVVRVGEVGIVADAPFYIAVEKGYFKERGIDATLERFASAAAATAPLSAGQLEVVGGGISPALFNAFARAFPVSIVAARSRDFPGNTSDTLIIRSDLKDQIRRFADLKGKKIAINAAGSPLVYMLGKMLESDGLSLKDVEVVYMPFPDMGPAFASKAIDAGTSVEPFVTQFQDRGYAFPWKRSSDVIRNPLFEVAVVLYNRDWAEKNPRAARDFMVAYIRASRDYHDAMYGGKTRPEVIEILMKRTPVKDRALYDRMQWGHIDPNGTVGKESLREQQDWYARQGLVPKKVDIDEIVDERYIKYAVEQLGAVPAKRP